jgi:hypothetical protein
MGKQVWVGEHLWNLLNHSVKELQQIYPAYNRNTLKGKKSYWTKQLREGKIQMPPKPEQEPVAQPEQLGRLYKTWEVSAFNKETQEWETTVNHGYEYTPDPMELAEVYEPALQAKITPTRKKRIESIGRSILVFGDSQIGYHRVFDPATGENELIPTHSEPSLSVVTQLNARFRPHEIVNVSDTVDLAEFGRFDPASDSFHRTLSPAFQRAHNLYAQLRADNPDAKITEVDSNHTARVTKNLMKKMPEMYGFTLPGEEYPLMTYYRLANLAPLDVNFISGYGGAEYTYGEDRPIIFKHGTHSSSNAGATVKKESQQNPTTHVVRGHGHSYEHIIQTDRTGYDYHYIQLGTTCETGGAVPSYHSAINDMGRPVKRQENWSNQAMWIEDYGNGVYSFTAIDIISGIARFRNEEINGNE